jgi:diguanylate cyclase (GGDEF)-like protein
VNDALGHEFGDLLLKAVTLRLRGCTRETDTVARLGGDEFALIHAGLERSEWAAKLAEKVLERLSEPFSLEGQEVHISASIGVTICPLDHDDPHQIVKNADMAMYRAKSTGRGNYQFYKEEMNLAFQARKVLERDLRKALGNGELDLFYQPQIDARRSLIIGAEALLRWPHPDRGMISPAEFVPIAEECGLIVPLGEWVLETACMQNKIWQDLGSLPGGLSPSKSGNVVGICFIHRHQRTMSVQPRWHVNKTVRPDQLDCFQPSCLTFSNGPFSSSAPQPQSPSRQSIAREPDWLRGESDPTARAAVRCTDRVICAQVPGAVTAPIRCPGERRADDLHLALGCFE